VDKHPWACPVCGSSVDWKCYSAINVEGIGKKKHKARFQTFPANPPLVGATCKELKILREKEDQIHFDLCIACGTVVC